MDRPRPTRKTLFFAMLALCLAAALLRAADLALFTDRATGYAVRGPALLRVAVPAAVVIALCLAGRMAAARPAALEGRRPALRATALLTAAGLLGTSAASLGRAELPGMVLDLLLPLLALSAMVTVAAGRRAPAPPAWLCAVRLLPWFALLLLRRALLEPAAVSYLPATLRVLSAAAALVFAASLLRMTCLPEQPGGQRLFAAGFAAFLFCTCLEGQQTLYELLTGAPGAAALCTGAAMAAFGLCGLACAWYAAGPGLPEPAERGRRTPARYVYKSGSAAHSPKN